MPRPPGHDVVLGDRAKPTRAKEDRLSRAPAPAKAKAKPGRAFPRRVAISLDPMVGETKDSICSGDIQLLQKANGYRFNLDPVLLAHYVARDAKAPAGPLIDFGTGCGIIPIVLARKFRFSHLTGLELQPSLFSLAQRNVQLNRCEQRIALALKDLRRAPATFEHGSFSHVVCNPPYRPLSTGNRNPQVEKAIARFEVQCTLKDVTRSARVLLRHGGALSLVYPAARLVDALEALRACQLEPKRLRLVHPRRAQPAKLVLLTAIKGGHAELGVLPPLFLHESQGDAFSPEVQEMIG